MANTTNDHAGVRDRCQGVLLGLAAGDRNGGPLRLALGLARSLSARGVFDPEDVFDRYRESWRAGNTDTGPTMDMVIGMVEAGCPRDEAVARVHADTGGLTAGCNPAHRAAPLAMASFLPDEQLADLARAEAHLTHQHPLAGEVSVAVVVLCRALLRGVPWEQALEGVVNLHPEIERRVAASLEAPGGWGGYAPELLQAALHFTGRGTDFTSALLPSLLGYAGPANYCPILVGALAGARWGVTVIPDALLTRSTLEPVRAQIEAAAATLAVSWA